MQYFSSARCNLIFNIDLAFYEEVFRLFFRLFSWKIPQISLLLSYLKWIITLYSIINFPIVYI